MRSLAVPKPCFGTRICYFQQLATKGSRMVVPCWVKSVLLWKRFRHLDTYFGAGRQCRIAEMARQIVSQFVFCLSPGARNNELFCSVRFVTTWTLERVLSKKALGFRHIYTKSAEAAGMFSTISE